MSILAVSPSIHIAFEVLGEGPPIVLVHGFASSRRTNWRSPGWYDALTKAGRCVIAMDVRGHGESSKPHTHEDYDEGALADDIVRLLDHLGHVQADVMGYSMGGFITIRLMHDHGHRVRRAVIAGLGDNYYGRGVVEADAIAAGLRAADVSLVHDPVPKQFRLFAQQGGNDLEALALCMTRQRQAFDADALRHVQVPTLIVLGDKDNITGSADVLAASIPRAIVKTVPGRDHMSTVGDKVYKAAVLEFLQE